MSQFHIRVKSDEYDYYSFYNVEAPNNSDASILARMQFAADFGGTFNGCSVGYVWNGFQKSGQSISDETKIKFLNEFEECV